MLGCHFGGLCAFGMKHITPVNGNVNCICLHLGGEYSPVGFIQKVSQGSNLFDNGAITLSGAKKAGMLSN